MFRKKEKEKVIINFVEIHHKKIIIELTDHFERIVLNDVITYDDEDPLKFTNGFLEVGNKEKKYYIHPESIVSIEIIEL